VWQPEEQSRRRQQLVRQFSSRSMHVSNKVRVRVRVRVRD